MNKNVSLLDIKGPGFDPAVESLELHAFMLKSEMWLRLRLLGFPIIRSEHVFGGLHKISCRSYSGSDLLSCQISRGGNQLEESVRRPTCYFGVTMSCISPRKYSR